MAINDDEVDYLLIALAKPDCLVESLDEYSLSLPFHAGLLYGLISGIFSASICCIEILSVILFFFNYK